MKVFFFTLIFLSSLFLNAQQKRPINKNVDMDPQSDFTYELTSAGYSRVSVQVFDENKKPISADLVVINNETKGYVEQSESNSNGEFLVSVPLGGNFVIFFNKPGYLFQSVLVTIPDSVGYEKKLEDIIMPKAESGKKSILKNIYFENNRAVIEPKPFPDLDRVVRLMNDVPDCRIEISGHTDNSGDPASKRKLSEQRAEIIADSLISRGCDKKRIKYKGYGGSEPIFSNSNEEGRKSNNRIEIRIMNDGSKEKRKTKEKNIPEADKNNKSADSANEGLSQKKKAGNNSKIIPDKFKKFDKDTNGAITSDEITIAIDSFFEGPSEGSSDEIVSLLDYFFED